MNLLKTLMIRSVTMKIFFFVCLFLCTAGIHLKTGNPHSIFIIELWKAEDPIIPPLRTQITDTTSTLTNAQKSSLTDTLIAFEKRKGSQIAVLIVGSTGDWAIEEYAVKVFETWKLGRKGIDDGILIVVAIQDHKTRIEVGYGLEGTIPDAIAKRIIEEFMIPRFREGNYFQGISDGIDKLILKIDGEELSKTGASTSLSDINVDSPITEEDLRTVEQKDDSDKDILDKYIVFLAGLFFAIFAISIIIAVFIGSGIFGIIVLTGLVFFMVILSESTILGIGFLILWILFFSMLAYYLREKIMRPRSFWDYILFGRPHTRNSSSSRNGGISLDSSSSWSSSSSSSGNSWSGDGGSSGGGGASGSW
ncbi:TPM domain-containing protein [Leptospira weilii]|uniref:TPM domain-containing protein n=1 Tax=Leptospira weilii TaxID=28184 RepID=UPI0007745B75|nr:TPM domain-containing protein [Leptospira weilii]